MKTVGYGVTDCREGWGKLPCCFSMAMIIQHEHPYISAMVNNGSLHYDHDRDGTHSQVSGCTVNKYMIVLGEQS